MFKGKKGADKGQYNRYAQMHVDYLLVTAKDFRPVAGVELDGKSHESERQADRDGRKNEVFKAAGLPLLRFTNGVDPSPESLRQRIEDAVGERKPVRA